MLDFSEMAEKEGWDSYVISPFPHIRWYSNIPIVMRLLTPVALFPFDLNFLKFRANV